MMLFLYNDEGPMLYDAVSLQWRRPNVVRCCLFAVTKAQCYMMLFVCNDKARCCMMLFVYNDKGPMYDAVCLQ